jgi:hypothetical protein
VFRFRCANFRTFSNKRLGTGLWYKKRVYGQETGLWAKKRVYGQETGLWYKKRVYGQETGLWARNGFMGQETGTYQETMGTSLGAVGPLLLLGLWAVLCGLLVEGRLSVTNELAFETYNPYYNSNTPCSALGYDYFNPSMFACQQCPSDQIVDDSVVDGVGNALGCKCKPGYKDECFDGVSYSIFSNLYTNS